MPRKPKAEIQVDIVKKERLRAKELIVSPEYQNDISQYVQLEKEMGLWRMDNRILIGPKEFRPSLTMQEHYEHMNKGRKLRQDLGASCDAILKKYKITFPYPIDTLKEIAGEEGEPKGRLRESKEIPVRVLPSGDGILRQRKLNGYEVYLDADECFSIEINPRGSKTDILHYISKLLDACAAHGLKTDTRTNEDKRLRDLEVYRMRTALKRSYENIAVVLGMTTLEAPKATRVKAANSVGKAYARVDKIISMHARAGYSPEEGARVSPCDPCNNKVCLQTGKACSALEALMPQDGREEPKRRGLINEFTPDPQGASVPAKGRGRREMGKHAIDDDY